MEAVLKILLIVIICLAVMFILAIVLTVAHENNRKKTGRKRKEDSIWEDRKRTFFGMPWSFTKYSLDNERFYLERGLFSTRYDEVRLYRITDVVLLRTLGQKIFGLGSLHIDSSDKNLGNFTIVNIKDSEKVKELFSRKIEEQRRSNRVYSRESIGSEEDAYDYDGFGDGADDHGGFL